MCVSTAVLHNDSPDPKPGNWVLAQVFTPDSANFPVHFHLVAVFIAFLVTTIQPGYTVNLQSVNFT